MLLFGPRLAWFLFLPCLVNATLVTSACEQCNRTRCDQLFNHRDGPIGRVLSGKSLGATFRLVGNLGPMLGNLGQSYTIYYTFARCFRLEIIIGFPNILGPRAKSAQGSNRQRAWKYVAVPGSVSITSIFEFSIWESQISNKLIVVVFLTRCRISMCQGLGPIKHEFFFRKSTRMQQFFLEHFPPSSCALTCTLPTRQLSNFRLTFPGCANSSRLKCFQAERTRQFFQAEIRTTGSQAIVNSSIRTTDRQQLYHEP